MKYRLSDICHYRKGKVDVSLLTDDTYISTENMIPNRGGITKAATLPTVDSTQLYKKGDVLVSNIRPYFKKIWQATCDGGCSNDVLVFQANEGFDQDYLYYVLSDDAFFAYAMKTSKGTKMPRGDKHSIMQYETEVCDLDTQRKIASLLKSIDSKIELNNAINNNLMQQIQSLFSDWFVTFTPFGGNKPSSWNKTDIYAISKVIYGAPFASKAFNTERNGVPIIRIRDLKEQQFVTYTTETHPKGYLLKPGDVVVGMDGEFRPYIWGNDKAWLNQRVCVFENKRPNGKAFLYCVIKPLLYAIEQTQVGTTVIHIGKKDFDSFEFWLPEDCVLDKFDSLTNPMYQQIVFSLLENKKLMVLRDTLLPKLLSGEINVSDIEL